MHRSHSSSPAQVSCSTSSDFSSSADLSSPPDTSDEHSATLVPDSPPASASTLTLATSPLPGSPPSEASPPNISVSGASSFLSLEHNSVYESLASSLQDSGPSSPSSYVTPPTSKLSSPYISPQYSFHSCCSSPAPSTPGSSSSLTKPLDPTTQPPSSPLRRVSSYPTKRRRSPSPSAPEPALRRPAAALLSPDWEGGAPHRTRWRGEVRLLYHSS